MTPPNETFLFACKPAMHSMCDASLAYLGAQARFHEQQLSAVNAALADARELSQKIDGAASFEELFELQAAFARGCFERSLELLGSVYQAAAKNQADALERLRDGASKIAADAGRTGAGAFDVSGPFALWKSMLDGASQAYTETAKAAESMALKPPRVKSPNPQAGASRM